MRAPIDPGPPDTRRTIMVAVGTSALIVAVAAADLIVGGRAAIAVVLAAITVALLCRFRVDGTTVLVAMVVAILLVPARLQLGPLGSSGTVSSLVGVVAAGLWLVGRCFDPGWLSRGRQPMRLALLAFGSAVLASLVGMAFRFHDSVESRASDRGIIVLVGMVGITLLIADGLRSKDHLRTLLKGIVAAGSGLALLGIAQFAVGLDIAALARIPGFNYVGTDSDLERSGFSRIVSTTSHPIEMSVVLGMLLPLALYVAFSLRPGEKRWLWWTAAASIGFAAPLTVSRTAVLTLVVAMGIVAFGWPRRRRLQVAGVAGAGLVVMQFVVPGLLGTLRALVFNYGQDPSISTRQSDYDYVATFISERPLFGRGWQTFLPERYTFLDNQMLLGLVEIGVVGTVLMLGVYVCGAAQVLMVRRRSTDQNERDLTLAITAALAVSLVSWFTYDAFAFPTGRALTFVVLGCAAALWRLDHDERRTANVGLSTRPHRK